MGVRLHLSYRGYLQRKFEHGRYRRWIVQLRLLRLLRFVQEFADRGFVLLRFPLFLNDNFLRRWHAYTLARQFLDHRHRAEPF